jgi:hypothetical protein
MQQRARTTSSQDNQELIDFIEREMNLQGYDPNKQSDIHYAKTHLMQLAEAGAYKVMMQMLVKFHDKINIEVEGVHEQKPYTALELAIAAAKRKPTPEYCGVIVELLGLLGNKSISRPRVLKLLLTKNPVDRLHCLPCIKG